MGKSLFIDVSHLERRALEFDATFAPEELSLPDNWKLASTLRAEGVAELLDGSGSRTIRVKGRIVGQAENACARCLAPLSEELAGDFELYFYPTSLAASGQDVPLSLDDCDIGYYEEPGMPLAEVVQEQVSLWLPIRGLCREDCKGVCPHCGVDRNAVQCDCRDEVLDSRWDTLRQLNLN